MLKRSVGEVEFTEHIKSWQLMGRGIVNLPKIECRQGQLVISVISIDNTHLFVLDRTFSNYHSFMSWYGQLIDDCGFMP